MVSCSHACAYELLNPNQACIKCTYMCISPLRVTLHTGVEPHFVTNVLNNHPFREAITKNTQDKDYVYVKKSYHENKLHQIQRKVWLFMAICMYVQSPCNCLWELASYPGTTWPWLGTWYVSVSLFRRKRAPRITMWRAFWLYLHTRGRATASYS